MPCAVASDSAPTAVERFRSLTRHRPTSQPGHAPATHLLALDLLTLNGALLAAAKRARRWAGSRLGGVWN